MPEAGPRPRLPVCVRTCTSKRFGKPTLVGQGQAGASGGKLQKNIESTVNLAPQFAERKCSKKPTFFVIASDPDLIGGAWQSIFICHCDPAICGSGNLLPSVIARVDFVNPWQSVNEIASSSRSLRDSSQ